jgi:hypothetical protein
VRGSLVDLAVQRLGKIDDAILSPSFFEASLSQRITSDPAIAGKVKASPAIIVRGGASLASGAARTAGIQIIGAGGDWAPVNPGECILNSEAATELGLQAMA